MIKGTFKKLISVLTICILLVVSSGCSGKEAKDVSRETPDLSGHPQVQIEMESGDKMVFELYPEYAPETVSNFVNLVNEKFYDGLTFHRIIKGFMIQGGDPNGNGMGSSDKKIKGEFSENGFTQNTLSHTRGVISMARSQDPDSASCQFFIMHDDQAAPQLDGKYAAFGKLISGEETLDKLADTPVTMDETAGEVSQPEEKVVIKSITLLK